MLSSLTFLSYLAWSNYFLRGSYHCWSSMNSAQGKHTPVLFLSSSWCPGCWHNEKKTWQYTITYNFVADFFALFGIFLTILSFLKCLLTEIVFIYISCNTQHVFTSHWRALNKFHCLQTWFTKLPPCFTPVSTLLSFYVVYICRNVSNNPNFMVHAPERLCFSHSCFLKYRWGINCQFSWKSKSFLCFNPLEMSHQHFWKLKYSQHLKYDW